MRIISRDCFARYNVVRVTVQAGSCNCAWCGNVRPDGKLFKYGIERDDRNRPEFYDRLFCSISCYRAYGW